MRFRQLGFDGRAVVGFGHACGQDQIDAERAMAHLLANPGQLVLDLFGRVARGAKHTETARVADRRHHGRVVCEAEYGLSDAKAFAQAVL